LETEPNERETMENQHAGYKQNALRRDRVDVCAGYFSMPVERDGRRQPGGPASGIAPPQKLLLSTANIAPD
jgi:hypothetical protein